jgi:hypothetical protein
MNQDSSRSHSVFSITIETIQQGPASVSSVCLSQHNNSCSDSHSLCSYRANLPPETVGMWIRHVCHTAVAKGCSQRCSGILSVAVLTAPDSRQGCVCYMFVACRMGTFVLASSTWWTWLAVSGKAKQEPQVCNKSSRLCRAGLGHLRWHVGAGQLPGA